MRETIALLTGNMDLARRDFRSTFAETGYSPFDARPRSRLAWKRVSKKLA